jgi:hypothetical protein
MIKNRKKEPPDAIDRLLEARFPTINVGNALRNAFSETSKVSIYKSSLITRLLVTNTKQFIP